MWPHTSRSRPTCIADLPREWVDAEELGAALFRMEYRSAALSLSPDRPHPWLQPWCVVPVKGRDMQG